MEVNKVEGTIQFLGEEKFLSICQGGNLDPLEIEILRKIFQRFDLIDETIKKEELRVAYKISTVATYLYAIPKARRKGFIKTHYEVCLLYNELSKKKH